MSTNRDFRLARNALAAFVASAIGSLRKGRVKRARPERIGPRCKQTGNVESTSRQLRRAFVHHFGITQSIAANAA